MNFLETMPGEEFLKIYFVWFLLTFIGMHIAQKVLADNLATTVIPFLLFEGLGVIRFLIGISHGMHRWELMFALMAIGGILFFVRGDNTSSSGGSCGGGGCGGGGCGGGGCGGCGG